MKAPMLRWIGLLGAILIALTWWVGYGRGIAAAEVGVAPSDEMPVAAPALQSTVVAEDRVPVAEEEAVLIEDEVAGIVSPDDGSPTLRLRVLDPWGRELKGARLTVVSDGTVIVGEWQPPIVLALPAKAVVDLLASYKGGRAVQRTVEMPERGILDVDLVIEALARPSLELLLSGAEAAGVDAVRLEFDDGTTRDPLVMHVHRQASDLFVVDVVDLAAGDYELGIGPSTGGGSWYVRPVVVRVWLPADGPARVSAQLTLGARCQVELHGPESGAIANIRLTDAAGSVRHEYADNGKRWLSGVDRAVVPAGAYTLEVDAQGYRRHVQSLWLAAGKTEIVRVELQRQ